MNAMSGQGNNYAVAILIGAVGGGLLVALVSRAIPKMMTQMASGMMQNMITRVSESGFDPSEM
jgi:hypothetical protein